MTPLETSFEVWTYIRDNFGLDPEGYDTEIVEDLRQSLDSSGDVGEYLLSNEVPVEEFVPAFFSAIAPFSAMMSDILRMFESAGARASTDNIQIRFEFDDARSDLEFDLESFRSSCELWHRSSSIDRVTTWNFNLLWDLHSLFKSSHWSTALPTDRPELVEWLDRFEMGKNLPPVDLERPRSDDAEFDAQLGSVWSVWQSFLSACHGVASGHQELREEWYKAQSLVKEGHESPVSNGWPVDLLGWVESDFWSISTATGVYRSLDLDEGGRQALKGELTSLLDRIPEQSREAIVKSLIDVLQLPYWKHRYELYSIWIGQEILKALESGSPRIHHCDGVLEFSFSGSHLATIGGVDPELHLWSEKRWPHDRPISAKRKSHIQPDYSLMRAPISQKQPVIMAVECKQYKKSSTKNFSEAVIDYATGLPKAKIVLVNYGPISDSVQQAIPVDLREQIKVIERVRPGFEESIRTFRNEVLRTAGLETDARGPNDALHQFRLRWTCGPQDLDLHIVIESESLKESVSYEDMGAVEVSPFATLDRDVTNGSGVETITLHKVLPATYRVFVNRYSSETDWSDTDAVVEIISHTNPGTFELPAIDGAWWHVFDYDGRTRIRTLINKAERP